MVEKHFMVGVEMPPFLSKLFTVPSIGMHYSSNHVYSSVVREGGREREGGGEE